MYLELFKLRELPFGLSPDPQFLYLSKAHARAKAYMESTIWFTDGFVVITGEIGCGKTTLIETFLRELEKDVVVAQIAQTQVSSIEFLQSLLVQFGFKPFRMKKAELLATLNDFLVEQYSAGRKVMLIVDEAQNLSLRVLEEVRMLSGVETTKEKVLRIILAGQPELNQKLDAPELAQLTQRVRLRFHLPPLSAAEMQAYILHRLEVAGSQGRQIFASNTFDLIYRYTGGVPRLVNTLCDTSMLAASNLDRDTVGLADIEAAIDELQWVEHAARTGNQLAPPHEHLAPPHEHLAPLHDVTVLTGERHQPHPAAPSGPALAKVLIAVGGQTIGEKALRPGRLIIGRANANDLQIDSRFISRHHCQIVTTAQACVIEDLNSTNGIYVQSRRVRRHNLNDGDVVMLGEHELIYVDERAQHRIGDKAVEEPDGEADPPHAEAEAEVKPVSGFKATAPLRT
jgi:general secretion pathway protein A